MSSAGSLNLGRSQNGVLGNGLVNNTLMKRGGHNASPKILVTAQADQYGSKLIIIWKFAACQMNILQQNRRQSDN